MTAADDRFLDAVRDLSRLSDRQLLERMVRAQTRLEIALSAASDYMTAALDALDMQMTNLQTRMSGDAAALQAAIDGLAAAGADTAALAAAAARVQATADVVATLDQPSVVADPETPVEATPVDPEPTPDPVEQPPAPPVDEPAPVEPPVEDPAPVDVPVDVPVDAPVEDPAPLDPPVDEVPVDPSSPDEQSS